MNILLFTAVVWSWWHGRSRNGLCCLFSEIEEHLKNLLTWILKEIFQIPMKFNGRNSALHVMHVNQWAANRSPGEEFSFLYSLAYWDFWITGNHIFFSRGWIPNAVSSLSPSFCSRRWPPLPKKKIVHVHVAVTSIWLCTGYFFRINILIGLILTMV